MGPAQDHMASSFTARRPNASHLPAFELPPPPLTQKYHSGYSHVNHSQHSPATTLTSVGNLLTPPSNGSVDGISPATSVPQSNGAVQSYTPSNGSGMWPPPASNAPYGFQPSQPHHSSYQGTRSLFSPSLNSIIRGSNSPTASEALPPPPYSDMHHHYPSSSIGMSQSTVPAPQQYSSMPVPAPVTQASPVHNQEAFARPPPTPTTSYYSQQSYSTGPSPVAQSPMSGGGLGKMSPVNQSGPVPPLHQSQSQYAQQYRPHSYSGMGGAAVLSGHSMGGVPGGMIPHFNSGHAAQMHHMYGHPQPNPQNDRPFRCDQCPQSFNRNHDLKRHKRIHLAVKPFPCGHCDKSFSRKDALKRHVLVKGCGKAGATSEVKELDGSISPKSESLENSPVVSATA